MAFYSDWERNEWLGVAFIAFVLLALVAYVWLALKKKPPAHLLELERSR